jgi:hypothetical protein
MRGVLSEICLLRPSRRVCTAQSRDGFRIPVREPSPALRHVPGAVSIMGRMITAAADCMCRAKLIYSPLTCCFVLRLGCSVVFGDQVAEHLPTLDLGSDVNDVAALAQRRFITGAIHGCGRWTRLWTP